MSHAHPEDMQPCTLSCSSRIEVDDVVDDDVDYMKG